jgi:hypothetical protein
VAVLWLGALLHALFVGRRDKKIPTGWAEQCIIKTMRKQNPGINYFAPSDLS